MACIKIYANICTLTFKHLSKKFLYLLLVFAYMGTNAQPPANSTCEPQVPGDLCNITDLVPPSAYIMEPDPSNVNFIFDSFGEYLSGITYNGATNLKLDITESTGPCRWRLHTHMVNLAVGCDASWDLLTAYGPPTGALPTMPLLQVRMRNECNTPIPGNAFFTLATDCDDELIINSAAEITPTNPGCTGGGNVNTEGSFLVNYDEYHFNIDYRVVPGFTLRPGLYQLTVRFCLSEGP